MKKIAEFIKTIYIRNKYNNRKRDKNVWLFGEWFGEKCCDNSFYFANYVAKNHPDIKVCWIAKDGADISRLANNIQVLQMDSNEAHELMYIAGVAFMNQGYVDLDSKNNNYLSGALVINLWHGVPWKFLGKKKCDRTLFEKIYLFVNKFLRNTDYYLATSDFFNDICESAFDTTPSHLLYAGYPRNSGFYDAAYINDSRSKIINEYADDKDATIITYMPTFRDKNSDVFSFAEMNNKSFEDWLSVNNIIIIEKMHYVSEHRKKCTSIQTSRVKQYRGVDGQELLAATDILITDYSSCFFDFLILDRPIIHFLYDYEYYKNSDRGLFMPKEEAACGDIAQSEEQLIEFIISNFNDKTKNKLLREKQVKKYMQYSYNGSCEDLYSQVSHLLTKK